MKQKLFSLVLVLVLLFFNGCSWSRLMSKDKDKAESVRALELRSEDRNLAVSNATTSDFEDDINTSLPTNRAVSSRTVNNPQPKPSEVSRAFAGAKNKEQTKTVRVPVYRVLDDQGNVIYVF